MRSGGAAAVAGRARAGNASVTEAERSERYARVLEMLIALAPQLYATPELARQWQQALRDRRETIQPRLWETDRSQGQGEEA
jgi:hypothetical protein